MTHVTLDQRPGWIAEERLWLHDVFADVGLSWGGLLVALSFVTLVTLSAMGWLSVLAVLIDSVLR